MKLTTSVQSSYKRLLFVAIIGLIGSFSVVIFHTQDSYAIDPSQFQAGRIIDDQIFYNANAMGTGSQGVQNIQTFINAHTPSSCDTWGTAPSGVGSMTDAQYAQSQGWPGPPYVCLQNYYENPSTGQTSFEMGGGAFAGGESAAQIIYDAAQQYGINPEVLLVTLRKESLNLFGDSWPLKSQYAYSMGYACPDSGPSNSANCNSSYAGFYNQINLAAHQFSLYKNNITSYNYQPGRTNYIQYSTNASCGGENVYIQNIATASLYNYTPYVPNQASLDAYPGTASCGSYGNRNFWYYFQEWFGPTLSNSNFMRTTTNATVYLLSGSTKYPISDQNLIAAMSQLGGVGYTTQANLDTYTTGATLGRFIRSPDGTIYYYDSAIKLPFSSCAMVADYGETQCGAAALLTNAQIESFVTGPAMTNLMGITTGQLYYVKSGIKHEVYDQQSLQDIGVNTYSNTLAPSSLSGITLGAPTIRSDVVVTSRSNNQKYLYSNNTYYSLPVNQASYSYIQSLPSGMLDGSSIGTGQISNNFSGFVTDAATGSEYILMPQGKVQLTDPSMWGAQKSTVDDSLITSLPTATDPINNGIIMKPGGGTVYYVTGGEKRPVPGWGDLLDLRIQPFTINTIDATEASAIPTGPLIYAPGHLVKTADSATVYIVKNNTELLPISSFLFPRDLGLSSTFETMNNTDFSSYTVDGAVQTQVICGGQDYVGINGTLYPMSASDLTNFGLAQANFVDIGSLCGVLSKSTQPISNFLLDGTGTIYLVQSGAKHAFTGYGAYLANGGSPQNTMKVSNYFTSLIPNGTNISQ